MTASRAKVSFGPKGPFSRELEVGLAKLLAEPGVEKRAYRRLHSKAAFIFALWIASYVALLTAHSAWLIAVYGVCLVVGVCMAAFCIQHDANHGGFSKSRSVNRLMGYVLDVIGTSSYLWDKKHNLAHHRWTNVDNIDEDIGLAPLGRMAESQRWRRWHPAQRYYLWFFYGFMVIRLWILGDAMHFVAGHIGPVSVKRPKGWELFGLIAGKLVFIGWVFALPIYLHHGSWQQVVAVLGVVLVLSWLVGLIAAVTFQLAHCVNGTAFTSVEEVGPSGKIDKEWSFYEVLTTADFSPKNPIIRFVDGGLNFQIEHHLFPEVPHTLYPALAERVVQPACKNHGVHYNLNKSLWQALKSHHRHLAQMGRRPRAIALP